MRLTVFALSCPPPELPHSIRMDFGAAGGRIGRGTGCTLVLRDPNRHISREHAEIRARGGEFVLKVVSKVNSVAVNDTSIGPGEGVTLGDGDQIVIGDYVLGVEIDSLASTEAWTPASQSADPFDLFAERPAAEKSEPQHDTSPDWFRRTGPVDHAHDEGQTEQADFDAVVGGLAQASPFADVLTSGRSAPVVQPHVDLSPMSDGVESFLRSLDAASLGAPSSEVVVHPELYRTGSLSVPFQTVAAPQVPAATSPVWGDDIFKTLEQDLAPPAPEVGHPARVHAQVGMLPVPGEAPVEARVDAPNDEPSNGAQTASPAAGGDQGAHLVGVLAAALGLQSDELDADRPEETMRVVGQLLRLATDGLFRMLEMRSQLKAELRIEDRTMIASRENNPLKHADSARDAARYLVDVRQHGNKLFMPPDRAVEDAISDICAHEMAVMAGTRAALLSALKMFSPEVVEKRIKKTGALENVVPALHKSRLWERFLSMYAELEQEAEQNFDRLLNSEFAKAYSEQNKLLRKRR